MSKDTAFTAKLDKEALDYFNSVTAKPFSQQAVHFLNAYWPEVSTEAEFVYSAAWDVIKYADMHAQGISLIYKYDEGKDLDFNIGLYFYEKLCKKVLEDEKAKWGGYTKSQPEMLTAIVRKKELKDKVDVNFDGRISFLEYLLYQYRDYANPADFCVRSMSGPDEHEEIRKARLALAEVEKAVKAYEAEKARLTEASLLGGVKGLRATNELAQLNAGPLWEKINKELITAEAAVRIAVRKFGGAAGGGGGGGGAGGAKGEKGHTNADGAVWWLQRELREKQERYGGRKLEGK